ncbi:TPA: hypothetical protein DIU27_03515 [Candidatus Collierbacteria bacterium]|uniref:Uncharacterized protein n=1 Tax=Candidatus Collierbacteria bacterium GW2011_GWB2_44_22 TaxID=1618387 RepID=A0A0G1K7I5_9BACT|nr:MAG: hypothetical protein UW31_C0007G0027 [Candidatus Collierbacteria bacterium GW2011_GWA2_44_13]KKT50286.1 MAG: hypothetical protein UW42_C0021G0005 [Candidatus Collierbacteria bacterium GW2011_GWB1_44_197]KKT52257.1 MAG: hypothetical protein UW44_C0003G0100 [Candidatus Collierbacteria bacterium GW2011_GWB2_44_22]KKT63177.1 MAG: hypothetical protein UW56_C0001G0014 [Candidatus Collierbacteria bacterium GW2011_GWD1_44_27]KKT66086.1 MAG: hypothetical protein UW58_C0013G0014 [Candidatus Colli
MKNVSLYLSDASEILANSLTAAVQNVILKVTKIETTVSISSVPITRGVSIILHDFNLQPWKAATLVTALKLATYAVLGGKIPSNDIHVTMHGSVSTDL